MAKAPSLRRLARVPDWLRHRALQSAYLAVRTVRDSIDDRVLGLAAEVTFFVVLALPPLLLVFLGLLGYVTQMLGPDAPADIQAQILEWAATFLTPDTVDEVVRPAVEQLLAKGRADVVSIAMLIAVWSASRAARAVMRAVTIAYDREDHRTWWTRSLLGLSLTVAAIVIGVVVLPLLVLGPEMGGNLADEYGLAEEFAVTWRILYWPIVLSVGLSILTVVYHIVAPHWTPWRRDFPGAVLALTVWGLGSFGLRIYALTFIEGTATYALFAAPLIVLLWLYVASLAVLLGAELNSEIEKMWPAEPAGSSVVGAGDKENPRQSAEPGIMPEPDQATRRTLHDADDQPTTDG
jgi:membrane protein